MKPEYLTPKEAAARLGITPSGIRWLVDTKQLKAIRTPSGRRFVLAKDLERLVKERQAKKPTETVAV